MEFPNQNAYALDVDESAENFAAQFDPTSVTFHGGDPTLVPLGGTKVPEQMETIYPANVEDLGAYINQPIAIPPTQTY